MMDERLLRAGTVVFDVGKVLLTFEPDRVASLLPAEHRAALKEAMFGPVHRWSEFDLGLKSNEQIADEIAAAASVSGGAAMVLEALYRFPETMEPLPLYRCIDGLKCVGKKLYALTNYAEPSFWTVAFQDVVGLGELLRRLLLAAVPQRHHFGKFLAIA